jgi:hypothetical protein
MVKMSNEMTTNTVLIILLINALFQAYKNRSTDRKIKLFYDHLEEQNKLNKANQKLSKSFIESSIILDAKINLMKNQEK